MNRQLKKMIMEYQALEDKWYNMTIRNSTYEECKEAWLDVLTKRKEIAYKCAELLGIKDDCAARAIGTSIDRICLFDYVRYRWTGGAK